MAVVIPTAVVSLLSVRDSDLPPGWTMVAGGGAGGLARRGWPGGGGPAGRWWWFDAARGIVCPRGRAGDAAVSPGSALRKVGALVPVLVLPVCAMVIYLACEWFVNAVERPGVVVRSGSLNW